MDHYTTPQEHRTRATKKRSRRASTSYRHLFHHEPHERIPAHLRITGGRRAGFGGPFVQGKRKALWRLPFTFHHYREVEIFLPRLQAFGGSAGAHLWHAGDLAKWATWSWAAGLTEKKLCRF